MKLIRCGPKPRTSTTSTSHCADASSNTAPSFGKNPISPPTQYRAFSRSQICSLSCSNRFPNRQSMTKVRPPAVPRRSSNLPTVLAVLWPPSIFYSRRFSVAEMKTTASVSASCQISRPALDILPPSSPPLIHFVT